MWRKELIKNKIYGIAVIILGALSVLVERDATFFLFALLIGLALFFSKRNRIIN